MDYCKCEIYEKILFELFSYDTHEYIQWLCIPKLFFQLRAPIELEFMNLKSEINIFCKKQINEQEN